MSELDSSKKYFVISDVHSYYSPMQKALKEAGYDKENENHILICLGDIFDRGNDTLKMLDFFKSLPKERRILVRGNHELLLRDCYRRGFFYDYDESNGTARTMCHFCGFDPDFRLKAYKKMLFDETGEAAEEYDRLWNEYFTKPFDCKKTEEVIEWIESDDWVNFHEMGKYIFVHSWIPVSTSLGEEMKYYEKPLKGWRKADDKKWEKAMWDCPWIHFLAGSLPRGKTIVCGHWHVQDFHTHLGHEIDGYKNRNIYFSDHLIAIDACTAMEPHKCNVLVIEEGKCYDQHHNLLDKR